MRTVFIFRLLVQLQDKERVLFPLKKKRNRLVKKQYMCSSAKNVMMRRIDDMADIDICYTDDLTDPILT